jgi:hypothetical protein
VADLAALRELYAWMREEKILYARCGDLELRLEPAPPPLVSSVPVATSPDTESDEDPERRSLETLLYSSGAEVEPFLRAMRNQRAA